MSKRVLLVNPGRCVSSEQPPIGVMVLASYLQSKGHVVQICDRPIGHSLIRDIDIFKPDVVGISGTTATIIDALNCAKLAKSRGIYTVMGGHHVSALPEESIAQCDAIVVGEGEVILDELVESNGNGIFIGKPIDNLNDLPMPAYDLIDMDFYMSSRMRNEVSILSFTPPHAKIGCVLTSRGCPYKCIYCYNSTRQSKLRYRSPENVVAELKFLTTKYKINTVAFLEDDIFINKDRITKICNLIKEEGIKIVWSGNGRVTDMNEDILSLAYSAGCAQVAFGFESASNRILDVLCKGATVEDAVKAIELCSKLNLVVQGNFMLGNPTETEEEMFATENFITSHNIDGGIGVAATTPLPGTKLWEMLKQKTDVSCMDWDRFNYNEIVFNMSAVSDERYGEILNTVRGYAMNCFVNRKDSRMKKLYRNLMMNDATEIGL
jgi:anaerobic magnesium-protoporphyrin IX monomethyl ester cyclase